MLKFVRIFEFSIAVWNYRKLQLNSNLQLDYTISNQRQ